MPVPSEIPVIHRINLEKKQHHPTRQHLFTAIEKELNRKLLLYFTSFRYPVMIDDSDADMIEGILQKIPVKE